MDNVMIGNFQRQKSGLITLDPRIKLFHVVVTGIIFFNIESWKSMFGYILSMVLVMMALGVIGPAIKYMLLSLGLLFCYVVLPHIIDSQVIGSIGTLMFILVRFMPFCMMGTIIIRTVDVTELIGALNKLRFPRVLIVPFAVTVRFIPTIFIELKIIRDSMAIRNIQLSFYGFIRKPFRTIEYLLVPLLSRSGKIAEELAASAMTRAIDYPCKKTNLNKLYLRFIDYVYILYIIITGGMVIIWD
ncbi:energy-coupling factor transporter transmembrane component T family protein [Vallitalea guaymasensis]|uniref:energy-coupling factor transporter transmembrane component T family protein n=1 Tax=Vallitalea guaymasensis TaxID=1185412 RepID=UPI00235686F7|nr:energy-coupling factor transporter transmembrane component T [Vallitalea guaymasensis]